MLRKIVHRLNSYLNMRFTYKDMHVQGHACTRTCKVSNDQKSTTKRNVVVNRLICSAQKQKISYIALT